MYVHMFTCSHVHYNPTLSSTLNYIPSAAVALWLCGCTYGDMVTIDLILYCDYYNIII
jgi:hypothetical protein